MVFEMNMEISDDFLIGLAKANTKSRSTSDSEVEFDSTDEFLMSLAVADTRPQRVFRIYNLIAVSIDDRIEEFDLISTVAGRRRAKLRRMGYRVSLIETNSGDGIVHRVPDIDDGGRGVPNPIPYDSPRTRSRSRHSARAERLRNMLMESENRRLRKNCEQDQNDKCYIYRKSDNVLVFSGSAENAYDYLAPLKEKGIDILAEYVIYIPDHLLRKAGR